MLTDTTKQTLEFIKNNLEPIVTTPPLSFSSKSNNLLSLVFNRIAFADEQWKRHQTSIKIKDINHIQIDTSQYPDDIQQSIVDEIGTYKTIEFPINNRRIKLHVGYSSLSARRLENIIKRVYTWLHVASFFADAECSQSLDIYFLLTKNKKNLPTVSNQFIDRKHVNTAFTFACTKNNEIHIFREEEWFKVFIHETFHSFGLDFAKFDCTDTNSNILDIFNVNSDVRIFETYCEVWGELINTMFIAYYSTKWNPDSNIWLDTVTSKTISMMHDEIRFSLFQCAKVLSYYDLRYDELFTSGHNKKTVNEKYKEKSHVLSYYIIKSLFFFHLDEYIGECISINGYTINFNKGDQYKENMFKYCNIVKKLYKDPEFITALQKLQTWSRKNSNKIPTILTETLRMSLHELK
jgi:hypothetical protein